MPRLRRLPALLLAASTALAAPRPARACAPAPPPGVFVQIAEESAIIVWDEAARRRWYGRRRSRSRCRST